MALQLSRQLSWLARVGAIASGTRLPSIRGLGSSLGINLHTVRAAYRHLEEDGIVAVRHGSGAWVLPRDPGRAGFQAPMQMSVGVVIPSFNGFYRRFLEGVELVASSLDAFVSCAAAFESQTRGRDIALAMADQGNAGLIVATPVLPPDEVDDLRSDLPPTVYCDWPAGPRPNVSFSFDAIEEAVDHLVTHEVREVALVAPPRDWENMTPIHAAFERAPQTVPRLVCEVREFTAEAGAAVADRLADRDRPIGAVVASDELALGLVTALDDRGTAVPDEVAVVAVVGQDTAHLPHPSLTAVVLPADLMGRTAMEIVAGTARGDPLDDDAVVIPSSFRVGRSCGCRP